MIRERDTIVCDPPGVRGTVDTVFADDVDDVAGDREIVLRPTPETPVTTTADEDGTCDAS